MTRHVKCAVWLCAIGVALSILPVAASGVLDNNETGRLKGGCETITKTEWCFGGQSDNSCDCENPKGGSGCPAGDRNCTTALIQDEQVTECGHTPQKGDGCKEGDLTPCGHHYNCSCNYTHNTCTSSLTDNQGGYYPAVP